MKQMTVSDFKSHFSEMILLVANGETIQLLPEPSSHPIAVLSPFICNKRIIGTYDGCASFCETNEGRITEEEFLGF